MKAILLSVFMMGVALTVDAQATVKANFAKNDTTIYKEVIQMDMSLPMGQGNKKVEAIKETRFVVLDKTATGYKIECTVTDITIKGDEDVAEQAQIAGNQYVKGAKMILQTNAEGRVEKILNLNEVATQGSKNAIAEIEEEYKKNPMIEQVLPKSKALMAISQQFEEQALIDNLNENSFFGYYGKNLKAIGKEDIIRKGIKLTATYAVANNSDNTVVTMNLKSNMTENDVKKMMIDQMQKMGMGEEVTSQIEANWGQFKSMGMTNISATGTDYLTFLPNGWLQNTIGTANTKVMGMDMKFDTKSEISYKNWK
ncbi:hypothetical protein [Prevotella aurantiaca]|uniref:hypothetical protein n=1 Tax=Prevotella aurantiaca TaxID=596085 RepID=UPI0028DC940C|nr:hypothetical protein [Prevotella aurantiaca]